MTSEAPPSSVAGGPAGPARRPAAVFLSTRTIHHPPRRDEAGQLGVMAAHLDATLISMGGPSVRWISGSRVIEIPRVLPGVAGGVFFRVAGAVTAVGVAARRRPSAVVCQSPYEGLCVVAATRFLPRRARPRIVVEVHGDWRTAPRLYGSPLRRLVAPLTDRLAAWGLLHADRVRVVGSHTESLAREAGWRGETDRFIAFTDLATFLDGQPAEMPARPRVAFVGVLERYKGVDVLLEAWARVHRALPEATLTLAGTGYLAEGLRRQAEELGLDGSVEFLGDVPGPAIKDFLDASSCLVLPSRAEGLGRVILEAFARGRPVVASRVGGIGELVESGRTGMLVPPEDPAALAATLVEVLRDPEGLIRMGTEAREVALHRDAIAEHEAGMARLADWLLRSETAPGGEPEGSNRERTPGLRLLLFNLATDLDDPILGFTTAWIAALAKRCRSIDVVTMRAGRVEVPSNVRVFSVGKEKGWGEARRTVEFYRILGRLLRKRRYDACFVHMIHVFAAMAWPLLRARRIPMTMWYAHRAVTPSLRLAEKAVDHVVTAAPESFPIPTRKKVPIGQGVETDLFTPGPSEPDRPFTLAAVGRVSPIKRNDVFLEAVRRLVHDEGRTDLRVRIIGPVFDREHQVQLEGLAAAAGLSGIVTFVGSLPLDRFVEEHRHVDAVVSLSPTGMFDKTVLQAWSAGVPTVVCNQGFASALSAIAPELVIPDADAGAVVGAVRWLLGRSPEEREALGTRLREEAIEHHSVDRLAERLVSEILVAPRP